LLRIVANGSGTIVASVVRLRVHDRACRTATEFQGPYLAAVHPSESIDGSIHVLGVFHESSKSMHLAACFEVSELPESHGSGETSIVEETVMKSALRWVKVGRGVRRVAISAGVGLLAVAAVAVPAVAAPAGAAPVVGKSTTGPAGSNAPANAAVGDSSGSNGVSVYDPTTNQRFITTDVAKADQIISAYWTPQRRAAAKDLDMLVVNKSTTVRPPDSKRKPVVGSKPVGPSVVKAGTTVRPPDPKLPPIVGSKPVGPSMGPSAGASPAAAVNFTSAVGKVFFVDSVEGPAECSASTLNSSKARLVMTAGHCVNHGPGGTWASNWSFFPGYESGEGSAGHFDAFQLWAKNGWINNGDEHFDYGIAITQNNQFGQKVVNAVGGNGIIYNPGRPSVTSFGYPGNIAGGEQQEACQGSLSRRSITNSDQKLNCTWGNGASGGPMLQNYDTSFPRLGWIVSVIAYALSDDTATFGPYFDSDTQSLVNAADNASPA
jgi:V8-like Glu-specific endopeptidase